MLFIFALPFSITAQSISAPWVGTSLKGEPCEGGQGLGPFDYLKREQFLPQLNIVEEHHFTPNVQNLISGQEGTIPGDLDFALRPWPNHHRVLASLIRYALEKRDRPLKAPAECYLQRAINFSPKDATAQMLFGIYLHRLGYKQEALKHYQDAEKISPENPELHYNLGLLLVSIKKYNEAKQHAIKAYQGGYPLPGLKNQLARVGYWQDK